MTPGEWHEICDLVESLWGKSQKWSKARDAVYRMARPMDYMVTRQTVEHLFMDNREYPPSASEVLSRVKNAGGVTQDVGGPCRHPNHMIESFHDDGSAKETICVVCRTEFRHTAGKVFTVGDLEERLRQRREVQNVQVPA